MERLRRVPFWGWALLFSLAICLPRLGHFGFWDPWELKIADQAREMVRSGHIFDLTAAGTHTQAGKPLGPFLEALGIKIFGASELGARIFIALMAVGALMAVYWAGVGMFRRRAALLSTLVLGSMTLFVLEARQLTSDAPLMAALALALGGLARWAWPASGRRRLGDLAVGLLGLAVGYLAGGALTGVVLPALALTGAVVVAYGLRPGDSGIDDGTAELSEPGVGPDITDTRSFGASTLRLGARGALVFALLGAGAVVLLIASMVGNVAGRYSPLLGGVPHAGTPTHSFEALVRQLGFGLFPWSAVAVFALARPLIRLDSASPSPAGSPSAASGGTNPRLAFGQLYLFLFAALGFALSTYLSLVLGEARYVALPAIALAVGTFLDEALEGNRPEPVAGLLMGVGTMIVARDFFLEPEELASVHLFEKVRWPQTVSIGYLLLGVGLVAAAGVYTGLAARGRALGRTAARDLTGAGRNRRRLDRMIVATGRYGLQAAVACAVLFAFYLTQGLLPALSTHFSFKPVLESYSKFAKGGEKIAKYRVEGHGSGFYGNSEIIDIPSQDRLLVFLRDPARVFALVAADELAALDTAFKQAQQPYFVVDASSSRFLLLTNQLVSGQVDQNPLKKDVWMAPAAGSAAAAVPGADQPPWHWRIPLAATFGDAIELVGADFPESVRRPGKIPLDLYFRVKARPPGGYKIFVHFDGPAAPRVIGDHDPVNHTFATSYWLPGEYIRDHYETEVPLMTTPAGTYSVFVGFWPGGEGRRLKITQGPNDGSDRVRLGTLEVK
jgi:Dolichyl-phosphate-mannose-protein mannosyltransferase